MRYVAKIHVLDVLDQVVVSGYIYDADPITDPDHVLTEFTCSAPGLGLDDRHAWLLNSLYRCLVAVQTPAAMGETTGAAEGVLYTISETGDSAVDTVR